MGLRQIMNGLAGEGRNGLANGPNYLSRILRKSNTPLNGGLPNSSNLPLAKVP